MLFFSLTRPSKLGLFRLTVEVSSSLSLSHTHTHTHTHTLTHSHTHSVGLLRMIYQLVLGVVAYTTLNKHKRRISLPSTEFKPSIPRIKRLQTFELDSAATGIGHHSIRARYSVATLYDLINRLSLNNTFRGFTM